MFAYRIPHPKYDLQRYSTEQIKSWLETATLIEAVLKKAYNHSTTMPEQQYTDMRKSIRLAYKCSCVLMDRGENTSDLALMRREIKLDVNA